MVSKVTATSASALAIALLTTGVQAQVQSSDAQARPAPEAVKEAVKEAVTEVVVRGTRLSNQRAADAKRKAAQVSDVVASDDLNKLPDQNLAEAASRVAGVSTFQDEGAGLYIGVRGLSQEFVNVTLDGQEASVAPRPFDSNLRGANLEAIPSTFVKQVEVIKSATPDLDGDAIAGTVNLVTRSAFDARKPWLSVGVSGGRYEENVAPDDMQGSVKGKLSAGTTFGDGKYGVVFDANGRSVHRDNLKPGAWFGPVGDGRALPEEVGGYFYQRQEDSSGATAKFEFRPVSALQAYVSLSYFDSDIVIDKNKHALYAAVSNLTTGTFSKATATGRTDKVRYGVDGSLTVAGGLDYALTGRDTLSLKGSSSSSNAYQDDPRVDLYYAGPLSGTYSSDGTTYAYQFDAASAPKFVTPANYAFNGYRRYKEELAKDVDTVRADWTRRPAAGQGLGFKAGLKWRETRIDYTASNLRWRNPVASADFRPFIKVTDYRFPGTPNDKVVYADIDALSAYAEGLGASSFSRREGYANGMDYHVSEAVTAGYALADYTSARWRVIGGLRYEKTATEALNRFNRAENAAFVTTQADYSDLLPSVAATYFISDQWLLRLGASRTIGRPDIRDLARGETPPNDNGIYSRGNPDLKPRRSTNLDASLEYYFDGGRSLISAAVFRKDIQDEIFDLQTPYRYTDATNRVIDSYYVQPDNGGDARISGVELSLVKDRLSFLPGRLAGLGFSANLTLNDGSLDLIGANRQVVRSVAPEGLSKKLANAALFYEGERLSGRIAWRYASAQTQQLSVDGSGDLKLAAYGQTDMQLGYRLNRHFDLSMEVWNLFEDEQRFTNANAVKGVPNWYEGQRYGRAVWFGVNYKY